MRILVTGGAGYIGNNLVHRLLDFEHVERVIVYDSLVAGRTNLLFSPKLKSKRFRFVHGDILDTKKIGPLIDEVDIVFHLAARTVMPLSNFGAHQFEQVNTWGSAELSYLIEESKSVQKIIYLSSSSIYGFVDEPANEQWEGAPVSFYAKSKFNAEAYINRLHKKNKEVLILRCGNVFGYSRNIRFDAIINNLVFDILFKGIVSVEGDGSQQYSYISIGGITEILSQVIDNNFKIDQTIYNAVMWNKSINQILDDLTPHVPDFDTVYVSRNIDHGNIVARPNPEINNLTKEEFQNFESELTKFLQNLTY